jgi:hypothetical protein
MPATAAAPPSIYSNMSEMAMKGGGAGKPPDAGAKGGEAGASGAGSEEKKQILTTLLEVYKKWDKLESDPAGKDIISQMVALAEKYKKDVLKEGAGPAGGPPAGGGEAPPPPPDAGAGGGAGGGKKGPDVPA